MEKKKISIGIPCYNEEKNIRAMYEEITKEMSLFPRYDYVIVFADNGSTDNSEQLLRSLAEKDRRVRVILNQTNFGQDRNGVNITRVAEGDAMIQMPCDFQEPVSLIGEYIKYWEEGYDIVLGKKVKSKESRAKGFCRKTYYYLIDKLSDTPQLRDVIGWGLIDKKVRDTIIDIQLQDPNYALRHLMARFGYKIKLVEYEQNKREKGKSSYTGWKYFEFAITSLCNTSMKPLHIITAIGFLMSVVCMLVSVFYFVYKLVRWDQFDVGIGPMLVGVFFALSIVLFCIGIIGEYICVLLRRISISPLVVEKERLNFEIKNREEE